MKLICILLLVIKLVLISGCASVDSEDSGFQPNDIAEVVSPGDTVSVTTKSNGKYQFIVAGVTEEQISGGGVTIKNSDIKKLTVTNPDGVRKTFQALGVTSSVLNIIHVID